MWCGGCGGPCATPHTAVEDAKGNGQKKLLFTRSNEPPEAQPRSSSLSVSESPQRLAACRPQRCTPPDLSPIFSLAEA